jgi:hypothetical protein
VAQEQANQNQAQQYAAQQQKAALAGVNSWLQANKAPTATAPALQMPGASSPATIGGGVMGNNGQARTAPATRPMQPPPGQAQAPAIRPQPGGAQPQAAAGLAGHISPQLQAALLQHLGGQQAAPRPQGM